MYSHCQVGRERFFLKIIKLDNCEQISLFARLSHLHNGPKFQYIAQSDEIKLFQSFLTTSELRTYLLIRIIANKRMLY